MNKTLLFLLVLAIFSSCRALKDSPKYKLTDGVYKTKDGDRTRLVYVENAEDSVLVYQLGPGKTVVKPDRKSLKPQVFPGTAVDKEIAASKYWKNTFDLDVLTIPFKYRPSTNSFTPQLSNHLNGAVYLGYRNDTYELSYKSNPIGKVSQRVTHLGFSAGLATGVGVTPMNPWVTDDNINVEYDGFIWSKAFCVLMAVEKLNFGLALGFDHLLDENRKYWIYQGKPYLGLTVGLNLN
ncbi:hypothetical protein SAMN04487996_10550 [Dyadobacter soli]|uniref:Outer membrane protein beta-barrel domain-containing protein n=1 Tax=Dyadobacter soli TaxID=659014 RepID=A0A1G7CZB7_9BACT|nr:hypothetical protein [Dyadobacter soli]SDE44016.1 hypothetical protein SAMN04487996_10550 [Dyadobacter soli]